VTVQYDRQLSLIVGTNTGAGIEFGKLRVQFQVRRGDFQSPNTCDVKIYNVSPQTANQISTKEFTRMALQAGYPGNFGLIFRGVIKQVRIGRENAKDTYVSISAADGDEAYNFSPVAITLAKGTTPVDGVQALFANMARQAINQPITMGYSPDLSTTGRIRGRVFYGMTRDEMRDFAAANNVLWSIQNGALTLIPKQSYIPGDPILISAQTGLLGTPEQTSNGIEMRVLLNPQIKIGQLVKLQTNSINLSRLGTDVGSFPANSLLVNVSKVNADGLYYVMWSDINGDTRGPPREMNLTCLAVDAQVPKDQTPKGAVLPEAAVIRLN
jgi:hypothetical protein